MEIASNRTRLFEDTLPGLGTGGRGKHQVGFNARARCWTSDLKQSPIWGKTEEIALNGLLICSDSTPPLGAEVKLRLYTDHGELVLTAKVVHRLNGIGFGCRFVDLDEQQRVALRFLRTVQNTKMAA